MAAIGMFQIKDPGNLFWATVGPRGTAVAIGVMLQQLTKEEGDGLFNYLEETKDERKTVKRAVCEAGHDRLTLTAQN